MQPPRAEISRRQLLGAGAVLPLALSPVTLPVAHGSTRQESRTTFAPPTQVKPDYTLNIQSKSIAPVGKSIEATLINGKLPGPEIRYQEGEMFRVLLNNRLQVPTTVHWHGMIVPSYMDGVPDISQIPLAPNESIFIEYPLRQSGTYWYHSHYQFQEQSGLSGPLIIEGQNEPYSYDHDAVVFMSDWLDQPAEGIIPQIRGEREVTDAVRPPGPDAYRWPGTARFAVDVNYPGDLINGRSSQDPWKLKVRKGDRIRFRFVNGSTSSTYRVALDGHEMQLIAADGQNVEPVECSDFVIATAERYDALVTVRESGSFTLHAAALGTNRQAIGVIHTADVPAKPDDKRPVFTGKSAGMADYAALKSPNATTLPDAPAQTFDIDLGGVMERYLWSMAGEYYPEAFVPEGNAGPLVIHLGDRVRVRLTNSTKMLHPMHLHGHSFRLLREPGKWDDPYAPWKDTVGVGPGQRIDFEFAADNPGKWFFHCHNLYHLAAGMARVFRYEVA